MYFKAVHLPIKKECPVPVRTVGIPRNTSFLQFNSQFPLFTFQSFVSVGSDSPEPTASKGAGGEKLAESAAKIRSPLKSPLSTVEKGERVFEK